MKNQYVGDINDYIKYSILRHLTAGARSRAAMVCWMLTPDDGRSDGNLREYLKLPERFRLFDPAVFDGLAAVAASTRTVAAIEDQGIIVGADYFSRVLTDNREQRRSYFDALWCALRPRSLLFFDPDNGLAVASVPQGRKNSAKYLYWEELEEGLRRGHSVVLYQHFPRVQREDYVLMLLNRIGRLTPDYRCLFAICSSRVAYIVAASPDDEYGLKEAATQVEQTWAGSLRVVWSPVVEQRGCLGPT